MKLLLRYILFLVFAFSIITVADENIADSSGVDADSIMTSDADSKEKVEMLCDLCVYHRRNDPEKAVEYGTQALEIAETINYPEGKARSLDNIGLGYFFLGEYETALRYFLKSMELRRQLKQVEELGNTLSITGNTYQYLGDYTLAMQNYEEALSIRESINDSIGIATTLINMSLIHRIQREYPEAIEAQNRALSIYKQIKNENGIAYTYYNMANFYRIVEQDKKALQYLYQSIDLYQKLSDKKGVALNLEAVGTIFANSGEVDKAMNTYFEVLTIRTEINDNLGIADVHNAIGELYFEKGELAKAEEHLFKAQDIYKDLGAKIGVANALTNIGKLEIEMNALEKAEECFLGSLETAIEENISELLIDNYLGLSKIYERYGNYAKANKYLNLYVESIKLDLSERNKKALLNLQYFHGVEKTEREIEMLRQKQIINEYQLEEQYYIVLSLIGFSALIVILFFVMLARARMRTKHSLFLKSIIDSFTHPFYVIDADDNSILLSNTTAKEKESTNNEDDCIHAILHCQDCQEDNRKCPISIVKESGKPINLEHKITLPDGTGKKIFQIFAYPIFGSNGKIKQIIHYSVDITEKKLADEKIKETEEIFRKLTDTAKDGIIITDEDFKITFWNNAAERMFQREDKEVLGKKLWQYISCTKSANEILMSSVSGDEFDHISGAEGIIECFVYCKNEARIPVEIAFSTVHIRGNKHSIAILRDVSERKKAEEEISNARDLAEEALRVKSNFLANMSHELRTPLNGILGYSQILERDTSLSDVQKEGVRIIKNSGDHLLTLINDILDLAKLESNKMVLQQHEFYFKDFLKSLENIGTVKADQHGLTFHYEESQPLPDVVFGDERRIRQVLLNILSNAFKFTKEGSVELKVSATKDADGTDLIFEITDTGIGIAEDKLQEIFLPFQQDADIYNKSEGTGAGLSITKKLLELLNGKLEVKSDKGIGTTFRITIRTESSADTTEKESLLLTVLQNKRDFSVTICIVENDEHTAKLLSEYFDTLGIAVFLFTKTEDLLNSKKIQNCHLIIASKEALSRENFSADSFKEDERFEQALCLMLSESSFEEDNDFANNLGCKHLLTKPIKLDTLYGFLESHLSVKLLIQMMKVDASQPYVRLPEHDFLNKLYNMATMGDLKTIDEMLSELDKTEYDLFIKIIRRLNMNYELDTIVKILSPHIQN